MLKTRMLTALVGIPLVIAVLWLGAAWWTALVIIVLLIAGRELVSMYRRNGIHVPYLPVGLVITIFSLFSIDLGIEALDPLMGETGILLSIVILVAFGAASGAVSSGSIRKTFGIVVFAGLYIGFFGSRLVALRDSSDGFLLILVTLLVVWGSDSAAYFIGKKWGRRKLAPKVSPNKSVEGAIAGLVGAAVFSVATFAFAPGILGLFAAISFGVIVGAASQLGDLFESAIKRANDTKDSGALLPGHGGMLDRVDSLLFAGVASYYFFRFSGIV